MVQRNCTGGSRNYIYKGVMELFSISGTLNTQNINGHSCNLRYKSRQIVTGQHRLFDRFPMNLMYRQSG